MESSTFHGDSPHSIPYHRRLRVQLLLELVERAVQILVGGGWRRSHQSKKWVPQVRIFGPGSIFKSNVANRPNRVSRHDADENCPFLEACRLLGNYAAPRLHPGGGQDG
jgi:hypothetical protein